MKDYNELVRRSIRKDFAKANFKRNIRSPKPAHDKDIRRIVDLSAGSSYAAFRRLIVGKLVRIVQPATCGYWVQFVGERDRARLSSALGYSRKRIFLIDGAKFD